MPAPCFKKKDSGTPVCGVHNVPLIQHQTSGDSVISKVGEFAYLACPVSGYVVRDSAPPRRPPE
jgi:hypothetical protein